MVILWPTRELPCNIRITGDHPRENRLPSVEDLTNEEEKRGGDGVTILRYTTQPLRESIDEPRTGDNLQRFR